MLVRYRAVTTNHIGFGNARRAKLQLHGHFVIGTDPAKRVSEFSKKSSNILGAVPYCYRVDFCPGLFQRFKLGRFGLARNAPAGKNIEEARRAVRHVAAGKPLNTLGRGRQCKFRKLFSYHRRINLLVFRHHQPVNRQPADEGNDRERYPEQPRPGHSFVHLFLVGFFGRRSMRPRSAIKPPSATSMPPYQIKVT